MNHMEISRAYESNLRARDFIRWVMAEGSAETPGEAREIFAARYPNSKNLGLITRDAVPAASSGGSTWGQQLVGINVLVSEYVSVIRPRTVLGRIQGYRKVPFEVRYPIATAGVPAAWVEEGGAIAVRAMAFSEGTMQRSKIGGIVVLTDEIVRSFAPDAEALVEQDITAGIVEFSDGQFLDPTHAGSGNVSPASITYDAPSITASGDDADAVASDLKRLLDLITTDMAAPYIIMSRRSATHIASLDNPRWGNITMGPNGGAIWGIPVLTTIEMAKDGESPEGNIIVALDAAELQVADDGAEATVSREASLQMLDNPTGNSVDPTATTVVSLFQTNCIGVMVIRFLRWQMRRAGAVAYIAGVPY